MRPQVRFIKDVLKEAGCPEARVQWKESIFSGARYYEVEVSADYKWEKATLKEGNPIVAQLREKGLIVVVEQTINDTVCPGIVYVDDICDLKIPESYGNLSTHLEA